ncbi:MAG: HK97 family phage prohead protease [Rhodobacter sp.]|uniref:HK97 family phage prohead protease n=1 Tax=Pararhodobacter sp. TaxID=2127056 RepID=UPI001D775823|nr:HK97 family phage prohead protease [Pararhodobacter sp.]MCB1344718.1 HK97 family phage prohead protease [Paracoccaceae bacterium]MCC0073509.1 HK97 family phage prohead protease [Rhodobacter sp.]HPD92056.1 HK97 family phage prohead protease [Pararhodobacter sp.]
MQGLETKFHQPGAVALDGEAVIRGYASVFGVVDQGGDQVMPGAYTASLRRLKAAGGKVRMLWQHDQAQPIGVWDEVVEDAHGLRVTGRLLTEVEKGREAAALMAAGAVDGLSIGYRTLKSEKRTDGGRNLIELELWEVSLVTFPMLPVARVAAKTSVPGLIGTFAQGIEAARLALRG